MTEEAQPRAPRLRRLVRLGGGVLVVFAVLLTLAVLYLHSDDAAERARLLIESQGSRLLGEELTVQQVHIEGVLPPALRLTGVSVSSATDGKPLADITGVGLALDSLPLPWERRIQIESVTVLNPHLRVAMKDGELRDFQDLVRLLQQPRPEAPLWEVQVGAVEVKDASLRLSMAPQDLSLTLSDLDLAWSLDSSGDGAGNLGIEKIELGYGDLREQGHLAPFNFQIDSRVVTLQRSTFDLFSTEVSVEGKIALPDPPGAAEARPLTHALTARGSVDLPRLKEVLDRLPEMEGRVDLSAGIANDGSGQRTSFNIQGHDVLIHVTKPKPRVFKLENPSLIGHIAGGRVTIEEESVLRWGGGRVEPSGWLDLKDNFPFELELTLDDLELERVLDSVTVPGSWVSLDITGRASLSGHAAEGFEATGTAHLDVRNLDVRDGAWDGPKTAKQVLFVPRATLDTSIQLDSKHCLLEPARIRGPGTDLELSTNFLFLRPLGLEIEVTGARFDMADLSRNVAGAPIDGSGSIEATIIGPTKDLDITGSLELDDFELGDWEFGRVAGDVAWQTRGALSFTGVRGRRGKSDFESEVRLFFPDRRRGGQRERLELSVDAVVPRGHGYAEDLLTIFFGGSLGASGPVWGTASLSGPPKELSGRGSVEGTDIRYLWEHFDTLELDGLMEGGVLNIRRGWAGKSSGNGLAGSGRIAPGGEIDFDFEVEGMEIAEMDPVRKAAAKRSPDAGGLSGRVIPLADGLFSGSARLRGNLSNLDMTGWLQLDDFAYRGRKLGDTRVDVWIEDHVLRAEGGALDSGIVGELRMDTVRLWRYDYSLRWDDFDLTPFLPRTILGRSEPIMASMTGRLEAEGTLRDNFHHAGVELREFSLKRRDHEMHSRSDQPIRIGYRDGAVRFDSMHLVSPESSPGTTDLTVGGYVRPDGPLALDIAGTVDMAFIDFAYDVFDRAEAEKFQLELAIGGRSTAALEIEGRVELQDALLKTIYFPHAVEVKQAEIELRNNRITLNTFEGALGGGALKEVDGSYIVLDRSGYRPRTYGLKADCVRCTIRYPDFMPPATCTAELQFTGTAPLDLKLHGEVQVHEMVLREPLNWQRSVLTFRSKFTETLASADEEGLFGVELSFDSDPEALRIHNNIGDLRGTAERFRVIGDTQHVVLEGTVQIEGGTIPYSGHEFQFEPGYARFRDRESWFPELELKMWTDVDNRDETYRISYAVSGPLDSPKLRATAEPQLAESDINLLLLFGLTQEQLAEAELGDVVLAAGGAGLGKLGESTVNSLGQTVAGSQADALIPDRIEIVPVYTDTTGATTVWTVVTKEVGNGFLTLEGGFGIGTGRNMTVPTVLRAQLGFQQNIYLEGSWIRDDAASRPTGNFGLDLKFEVDLD